MRYTGEWKGNLPHGKGIVTYPDGSQYMGEFEGAFRHGKGTHTLPDGSKHEGEWKDGKQHGKGTMTLPDGSKHEGIWKNGELVEQIFLTYKRTVILISLAPVTQWIEYMFPKHRVVGSNPIWGILYKERP